MYKFYNANKKGNFVNDCVVRAISIAEHLTWDDAYDKLSDIAQNEGILLDDVNFVENYLDQRYERTCHYSKTVGEFIEEYPIGTYLITMPNHITVVKDGVIYDTFDCSNRNMWCCCRVE
jgi:hypothetical protein